jgi:hypothetical protein
MASTISKVSNTINTNVDKIGSVLDNPYVSGALTVFLVVYASMAAPTLPEYIAKIFDYTLVKFVMFFMIAYVAKRNATVALVASVALMVTLITLNNLKFGKEMMGVVGSEQQNGCSCPCSCGKKPIAQPSTQEGQLVVSEAIRAAEEGKVSVEEAKLVAVTVVKKEAVQAPVLVANSEKGAKQMEEVIRAEQEGRLRPEEARVVAAKVVVEECVNKIRNEEQPHMEESRVAVKRAIVEEKPFTEEQSVEGEASMADLAQEVIKRKNDISLKSGEKLSPDRLKTICADVLSEYKSQCRSCSDSGSIRDMPGLDINDSQYASA